MQKLQLNLIALTFWLSALLLTAFHGDALGSDGKGNADEWVARIFPKISNCTPRDWYEPGNPTYELLKKKGYKIKGHDEFVARFDIREKFYGFDAIEIAIPAGEDSIYGVTVKVPAKELAGKIFRTTGERIHVYRGETGRAESGWAYIVPRGKNKSEFVCFTYDEGE